MVSVPFRRALGSASSHPSSCERRLGVLPLYVSATAKQGAHELGGHSPYPHLNTSSLACVVNAATLTSHRIATPSPSSLTLTPYASLHN